MLLLNGTSGIGVGMATDIPSHNLGEVGRAAVVATIRNPKITLDQLLTHHPRARPARRRPASPRSPRRSAPSTKPVAAACACARVGRSRSLRAASGSIAVTELPFGVSTRVVLEDIERATNPKPKEGKKALSQEQLNLKSLMLSALDTVRDESDKSSPVRIVLEPRSSRQDPQEFMHLLLANTRLESSLPINLVMLGRDGRPRSKHLKQIIEEWIAFRFADGHAANAASAGRGRPAHPHSRRPVSSHCSRSTR